VLHEYGREKEKRPGSHSRGGLEDKQLGPLALLRNGTDLRLKSLADKSCQDYALEANHAGLVRMLWQMRANMEPVHSAAVGCSEGSHPVLGTSTLGIDEAPRGHHSPKGMMRFSPKVGSILFWRFAAFAIFCDRLCEASQKQLFHRSEAASSRNDRRSIRRGDSFFTANGTCDQVYAH
jgi:hypothetical protein